jgi:hypothetical protein
MEHARDQLHIMKAIQIVLDERTLATADREARRAKVNRSALFRRALALYVSVQRERALEVQHRAAYERHPFRPGEFDVWDRVLGWPET